MQLTYLLLTYLISIAHAVEAGFAVSVNEDVLRDSKKVVVNYMK